MFALQNRILPAREDFIPLCNEGAIPPLFSELPFKDPFTVFDFLSPEKGILLESMKGPEKISRYSFAVTEPLIEIRIKNHHIELTGGDNLSPGTGNSGKKSPLFSLDLKKTGLRPLGLLRNLTVCYRQKKSARLPPFQGGMIGLFSYDFVRYLEDLPNTVRDDLLIPDAHLLLTDRVLAFDHSENRAFAVVSPGVRPVLLRIIRSWIGDEFAPSPVLSENLNPGEIYRQAEEDLGMMISMYREIPPLSAGNKLPVKRNRIEIVYENSKKEYMDMVKRAKEYIHAGDIFQVNLSQRLSAFVPETDPGNIYRILRIINPAPFSAFADFGDYQVAGSSPERLIRLTGRVAEIRPIAGTRPRGGNVSEDERLRDDLLLNEKERAEHIMLIDLERNDLGKVCGYGTVEVDELMITEFYSHVIHIVSNVKGVLSGGRDAYSLFRAAFPGGTITGVPKVRCMEIIDELETVSRGHYTGSIGYIGFNGDMDLNIIIRTFVIKKGTAYVQAGAGIVADSDPEREYYETLKKAEALLSTLERL